MTTPQQDPPKPPLFSPGWERLLRIVEVLGPVVVSVGIFVGSRQLQRAVSSSDLRVKKVEVIAQMAQSTDETRTQQAILNLSSTLGTEAIPFLLARLEHFGGEIVSRRQSLLYPDIWPLPKALLSQSCQGDPIYSRIPISEADSLSSALSRAQQGWDATIAAIRLMGTDSFPKLFEAMRRNERPSTTEIYLRALVEIRAQRLDGMQAYLEAALNDPELDARSHGDALAVLANGGARNVELAGSFNIDLTCRNLPPIILTGGTSADDGAAIGQIAFDRVLWTGAELSNLRLRSVSFNATKFVRSAFTNVQFDAINATAPLAPRNRTLELDSTSLSSVDFDGVNLRSAYIAYSLLRHVRIRNSSILDAATLTGLWIDDLLLENTVAPAYMDFNRVQGMKIRATRLNPTQIRVRTGFQPSQVPTGLWADFVGDGYRGISVDSASLATVDVSGPPGYVPEWLRSICVHVRRNALNQFVCR